MTWSLDVIFVLDRTPLEDKDPALEIKADPENMQQWEESKNPFDYLGRLRKGKFLSGFSLKRSVSLLVEDQENQLVLTQKINPP